MRRRDFPADYDTGSDTEPDTIMMRGGSCIIDPLGNVLAGPVFDEETILYADLDLGDIARSSMDFDAVGHYARPDIFKLIVNQKQLSSVVFESQPQTPTSEEPFNAQDQSNRTATT